MIKKERKKKGHLAVIQESTLILLVWHFTKTTEIFDYKFLKKKKKKKKKKKASIFRLINTIL